MEQNMRLASVNLPNETIFNIDAAEYSLGKKADAVDGVIEGNSAISRRHCKLIRGGGAIRAAGDGVESGGVESYFVVDLGSTNGTYVNGLRLRQGERMRLNDGDILRLANSEFAVAFSNADPGRHRLNHYTPSSGQFVPAQSCDAPPLQQVVPPAATPPPDAPPAATPPSDAPPSDAAAAPQPPLPQVLHNKNEAVDKRAVIVLRVHKRGLEVDLDIPLDITAAELLAGLNAAYSLGIDTGKADNCYLRTENPIVLLRGSKCLYEYKVHNGTIINI
jgi:predicted component of type VI protein secretion system